MTNQYPYEVGDYVVVTHPESLTRHDSPCLVFVAYPDGKYKVLQSGYGEILDGKWLEYAKRSDFPYYGGELGGRWVIDDLNTRSIDPSTVFTSADLLRKALIRKHNQPLLFVADSAADIVEQMQNELAERTQDTPPSPNLYADLYRDVVRYINMGYEVPLPFDDLGESEQDDD